MMRAAPLRDDSCCRQPDPCPVNAALHKHTCHGACEALLWGAVVRCVRPLPSDKGRLRAWALRRRRANLSDAFLIFPRKYRYLYVFSDIFNGYKWVAVSIGEGLISSMFIEEHSQR